MSLTNHLGLDITEVLSFDEYHFLIEHPIAEDDIHQYVEYDEDDNIILDEDTIFSRIVNERIKTIDVYLHLLNTDFTEKYVLCIAKIIECMPRIRDLIKRDFKWFDLFRIKIQKTIGISNRMELFITYYTDKLLINKYANSHNKICVIQRRIKYFNFIKRLYSKEFNVWMYHPKGIGGKHHINKFVKDITSNYAV
jgi:hypothetical protein